MPNIESIESTHELAEARPALALQWAEARVVGFGNPTLKGGVTALVEWALALFAQGQSTYCPQPIREFVQSIKQPIVILFDGRCGFCRRTAFFLMMLNWLHRVDFRNFHDANIRQMFAPTIDLPALNEAMHAVDIRGNVTKGFFAFRAISWDIPVLWPIAPLLYLPGVSMIGQWTYGWIASHKQLAGRS